MSPSGTAILVAAALLLASGVGCGLTFDVGPPEDRSPQGPDAGDGTGADGGAGDRDGALADAASSMDGSPVADASIRPSDATVRGDGRLRDGLATVEASTVCRILCGDVDGDGMVGPLDGEALRTHLVSATRLGCPPNADVDQDGIVGPDDLYLLRQMIRGSVVDGTACTACLRRCGDINGDGRIDAADVTGLTGVDRAGPWTACTLVTADVNRDGVIDMADVTALEDYLFAGGTSICNR